MTTISIKLKNDVEELILKGGKTFYSYSTDQREKETIIEGRVIKSRFIANHINWLQHRNDLNISTKTINSSKNYTEEWIDYEGKVYCATVPFNKLFIKKDGKGTWCGNSPRFEWNPFWMIFFFKWQFCIHWTAPDSDQDSYWEQVLWFLNYANKNIKKAKEIWPWINMETNESSWNDKYLI